MSIRQIAHAIVEAWRASQREDARIGPGFERRVEVLLERELAAARAAAPPPITRTSAAWDHPSEQTTRLVPRPALSLVSVSATDPLDATRLRSAASRR